MASYFAQHIWNEAVHGSSEPSPSDVIIFTDGFYPDARPWLPSDTNPPRVGWVAFLQEQAFGHDEVLYSSRVLTTPEIDCWIPRINQIAMVELMAAVVALDHLDPRIRKMYVVLLIDSEAVEAGLIEGHSQEEDMSDLIAVFWDIVLSFDLHLYICKVPTDANPSDGASRGDFDELEGRGAKWVNSNPSDVVTCLVVWRSKVEELARKYAPGEWT